MTFNWVGEEKCTKYEYWFHPSRTHGKTDIGEYREYLSLYCCLLSVRERIPANAAVFGQRLVIVWQVVQTATSARMWCLETDQRMYYRGRLIGSTATPLVNAERDGWLLIFVFFDVVASVAVSRRCRAAWRTIFRRCRNDAHQMTCAESAIFRLGEHIVVPQWCFGLTFHRFRLSHHDFKNTIQRD